MKTKVINFYGGPGIGKSTSAAYLYYLLKCSEKDVDLVREYVKEWAWEDRVIGPYDQLYFLGKQIRKESCLYGLTEYIVTDSPIYNNIIYGQLCCSENLQKGINELTHRFYQECKEKDVEHLHIMLNRSKPYQPSGRYHTEAEARKIDQMLIDLFGDNIPFVYCNTDEAALAGILDHI